MVITQSSSSVPNNHNHHNHPVRGEDSDPGEGDADMEDLVQPDEHQTSEQMFSHVDHEDYVSSGAPSNQILLFTLWRVKVRLHLIRSCPIALPILSKGKRVRLNGGIILSKSLMSMVRRMFCRSLLRVRMKKAKKVCLGLLGNLCCAQRSFVFSRKKDVFSRMKEKRNVDI